MNKCPVCGKQFEPAPYHVYKIYVKYSHKLVCSWHCVREWEKKKK